MATRPGAGPVTLSVSHPDLGCECVMDATGVFLTVFIQEQLVEAQAAGLFADEAVHVLRAMVVYGDGVFQRFYTRLQAEWNLRVANSVPGRHKHLWILGMSFILCPNQSLVKSCADLYQN